MALFSRLKKLFSKPRHELEIGQVSNWFEGQVSSKLKGIDEQVKDRLQEIEHLVQDINPAVEVLQNARLKNENIQEKLKNYMTGNRDNYVKQVGQFVDWVEIPRVEDALDWCNSFIERVDLLSKSSSKSFFVLQEFFAHESGAIAQILKRLTDKVREIKDLLDGGEVKDINEVRKQIDDINNLVSRRGFLSSHIEELDKKRQEVEQSKSKKEEEIKRLEQSDNYTLHEKRILDLKDVNKKLVKVDDGVTQLFSPLRRAFKKYSRIGMHNLDLIDVYSDPLAGLRKDPNYRVLELLKAMRISIMKNELELDDKDKVVKKINEITRDKLEAYSLSYKHLVEKKGEFEKVISNDPTMYQLNELNKLSDRLASDLAKVNAEINSAKDEINKISIDELRVSLQEDLSRLTDSEVKVV
jgi:predicted  nucleic acid-binding Zn-ribbon protein